MAAKAELKGVLKLDNLQFVRSIKQATDLAKNLARSFAKNPLQASFVAGMMGARKAISLSSSAVTRLASGIRIGATIATVAGTAIAGVFALVAKSAIGAAAEAETFATSFEVLLGSASAAKQRMAELAKFANTTPFELPEVAAASRTLETLTKGALSTGKGLTLVGDLAAGTNTRFEEIAVTVGRLYDAIRSGRTAGESLNRLQEVGGLTNRSKIEGLITAGRTAEAWKEAQSQLSRYSGMMDKQSKTWTGRMSTFGDSIKESLRQFGAPLMEGLKPALAMLTVETDKLAPKAKAFGDQFSSGVKAGTEIIVGIFTSPAKLIDPAVHLLKGGFLAAGNVLIAGVRAAMQIIGGEGFFSSLAQGFRGVAMIVGGYFMSAFQKPAAYLMATVEAALARIPQALGGSGEREAAKAALEGARARAADSESRSIAAGGSSTEKGRRHGDNARKYMAEAEELYQTANGPSATIEQRADRILKKGEVGTQSDAVIREGEALLRDSAGQLFDTVGAALKNFKVTDVLGAGAEIRKGMIGIGTLRAKGAEAIARAPAPPPGPEEAPAPRAKFAASLLSSGGMKGASMLSGASFSSDLISPKQHPGLTPAGAANMQSSSRTTSLLSLGERRSSDNATRAEAMSRGIRMGAGGLSASGVRRGDRERTKEVQRTRARQTEGEKQTQILDEIKKQMFDMTSALTK